MMNPNYLSIDELEIECVVRNISGSFMEQLALLKDSLKLESEGSALLPDKSHKAARKSPKREFNLCSNKLKELRLQVTAFGEIDKDQRQDKLKILLTQILHITGRFKRLGQSSPSYREQCSLLLNSCDKLLEALSGLIESKLTLNDFEKSVSEALPTSSPAWSYATSLELTDSETEEIPTKTLKPSPSKIIDAEPKSVPLSIIPLNQTGASSCLQMQHRLPENSKLINLVASSDVENPKIPPTSLAKFGENPVSAEELAQFINLARRISLGGDVVPIPNQSDNINRIKVSTPEDTGKNNNNLRNNRVNSFTSQIPEESPNVNENPGPHLPIHKWNIIFDGTPFGSPIDRFLYRVEHLAKSNRIPFSKLVNDLHILLRKIALEWYWSYLQRNGIVQWENLIQDMRSRFQDRKTDFEIRQSIVARKQKFRESFLEFYSAILDSTLSLNQSLPESEIFFILRQNMSSELQLKLAGRKISTVPELVNQCVDIEDTWLRVNNCPGPSRKNVQELQVTSNSLNDSNWRKPPQASNSTVNAINDITTNAYDDNRHDDRSVYPNVNAIYSDRDNTRSNAHLQKSSQNDSQFRFSNQPLRLRNVANTSSGKYSYGCGAPNVVKHL